MNKNRLKTLFIFLTLPFLTAMYNGPHFYEHNISSYDLDYVSHEKIDDLYIYTYNFKSNASYYISSISLSGEIEDEKYELHFYKNGFSEIFDNVAPPYYEGNVKLSSVKEISDISKLEKDGNGFSLSSSSLKTINIYLSNIESITYESKHNNGSDTQYIYLIKFNENVENIYSCGVFEMNYNDETVYLLLDSSPDGYYFSTKEELNLTKLTVKNITLIETYKTFQISGEGLGKLLLIFFAILIGVSGILFCALFFFIRFLIRKNRKAKAVINS